MTAVAVTPEDVSQSLVHQGLVSDHSFSGLPSTQQRAMAPSQSLVHQGLVSDAQLAALYTQATGEPLPSQSLVHQGLVSDGRRQPWPVGAAP